MDIPKYSAGDEVMNTTGYKCYIESVMFRGQGGYYYVVSSVEEHDLEDDPQIDPLETWELSEGEIDYTI